MHPNMTGILIAVVVSFFLGWLWYGPLFGKAWAKELGISMDQKPPAGVIIKGMVIMVIGCFLTAWVLASDGMAWRMVPGMGMGEASVVKFGFMGGFFTWLGFYLPQHLSRLAWENKSMKLFWINALHSFIMLILVGIIVANWH